MDLNALTVFNLGQGKHKTAEKGVCLMEAVAWMEGEKHSDHPECACPVIGAFARLVNDAMPAAWRQKLVPFIPRLVGTRSPSHERERAEYLAWQAIRVFAPLALDAAGLSTWATRLRNYRGDLAAAYDAARAAADAYDARHAARAAASYAADAAADAARHAARAAADAAAYAAAYAAAAKARAPIYQAMIDALDGVLKIGPSGKPVPSWEARIVKYRELVK